MVYDCMGTVAAASSRLIGLHSVHVPTLLYYCSSLSDDETAAKPSTSGGGHGDTGETAT